MTLIHNPSYRSWNGQRVRPWRRVLTICTTGISRAKQSHWLKRILFAALLPTLFFAIPFFLFEQAVRDPEIWQIFVRFLRFLPSDMLISDVLGSIGSHPTPEQFDEIRHPLWSFVLLTFLRYPQAFLMLLIVGIVAPPLISQDLRTRAYLIYFSRPVSRLEYILGKAGTISFFLIWISAIPAIALYIAAVMLSPSINVVLSTWDLPLRIILASALMIIPTTLVSLAFSSLTLESRYAGFGWFAIWILGHVTYAALIAVPASEAARNQVDFKPGWQAMTSPYQVLGIVQSYVFGFEQDGAPIIPSFLLILSVSLSAVVVLLWRVAAPMRV